MLMVEKLHIPLEYQPQMEDTVDGLLITVDCQYGAGNVTELRRRRSLSSTIIH